MAGSAVESRRPTLRSLAWLTARCLLLAWVTFVVGAHLMANRMMFPAPQRPLPDVDIWAGNAEQGRIALRLHGDIAADRPVLLHCHGNAEIAEDLEDWAFGLVAAGLSVVIPDYPGYGATPGSPSAAGARHAARAAYDWLIAQGVPPSRIVLHGRSIGGGPVSALASEVPVAGLILESTFVAPSRVLLPLPLIPFDPFPVRSQLRHLQMPVAILHGARDEVIPVWHGRALAAAAPVLLAYHEEPTARHNDLSLLMDDYATRIATWARAMVQAQHP